MIDDPTMKQFLDYHSSPFSLILALLVLSVGTAGVASTKISPATSTTKALDFSKTELKEHNRVWKIMQKSCFGRWSGTMQTFTVEPKTHQLRPSSGEKLNFRLWAQNTPSPLWSIIRKKNTGTWTVWNLKTLGDEFIIPLRRLPSQRPSQLKIGFEGCVLRVPAVYKQVPRAVVELGFWDPRGDGMRRTVVVEYLTGNFKMELKDVTVVQQKAIPRQASFVGDMSVEEDIQMLPQKTPFGMTDVIQTPIKNSMEPIRMERVELQSMTRTTTNRAKMASDEKEKAWKVLGCLLSHDDDSYSMVLPNGLLTCLPKQLQTTVTNSFVFAHSWSHKRPLQAVHIEFDPTTSQAIAATMYSYEQTRKS